MTDGDQAAIHSSRAGLMQFHESQPARLCMQHINLNDDFVRSLWRTLPEGNVGRTKKIDRLYGLSTLRSLTATVLLLNLLC